MEHNQPNKNKSNIYEQYLSEVSSNANFYAFNNLGPLLLTWFNFNPSMDK